MPPGCTSLTGDPKDAAAARTFWATVTQNRSFVTGSNSDHEHFFALGVEAGKLGPENGETCNVYNMLKLTPHLARCSGQATSAVPGGPTWHPVSARRRA